MVIHDDWAESSSSEDEFDYENIELMTNLAEKSESPKCSTASSSQVFIFST